MRAGRSTLVAALATLGLPALAVQADGRWHPGIGDPTWIGWFTVLVYAATLAVCLRAWRVARQVGAPSRFWALVSALMLALGLNKQLDLQSWFTEVGRNLALQGGWYQDRRKLQLLFILALAVGCIIGLLLLRQMLGQAWRHYRTTCTGLGLLATFVVMRAASFHHVDVLLNLRWGAFSGNGLAENTALAVVALGAWRAAGRLRHTHSTA